MLHALATIALFLPSITALSIPRSIFGTAGTNIILSNDDGWAELNIRTFFDALTGAPNHFNVVMSAPSENKSGTGSTDVPPTVLNTTCEFDTCPVGSPPEGFNASDREYLAPSSFTPWLTCACSAIQLRQFIPGDIYELWHQDACPEVLQEYFRETTARRCWTECRL
jgi:hypothetical protein